MIRHRRFLTPTTYPVPTIPANGALSGNSLMTSVPVRCPLKREVDNATRIFLDENLMRQIYLTEVGHIDQRYLAETLAEARANLHQVNSENNKVQFSFGFERKFQSISQSHIGWSIKFH